MDVLKLDTNRPVELSFKFITGKPCESQFSGAQKLFSVTLANGETKPLYLSEAAGARIEEILATQKIRPGEFVDLCKAEVKNGNRKGIEYQLKRVNPPPESGNGANGSGKPPAPPAATVPQLPQGSSQANGSATNGHAAAAVPQSNKLGEVLCGVIDACHRARLHAKEIGYELPVFNGDEIVRMVNTVMIQGGGK
jgi:hypothetical protein